MIKSNVAELFRYDHFRKRDRDRDILNKGRRGSVFSRSSNLWVDFYYLGERVREPVGLIDTRNNRLILRKKLDLIIAEIENGIFVFADRFPRSKRKDYFSRLEGRRIKEEPDQVLFGKYYEKWWEALKPGMSESQRRDYESILRFHLLPFFRDVCFSEITSFLMKEFLAKLKSSKNSHGDPLSAKRIYNILIPIRAIFKDAIDQYGWTDLRDPFLGLKLPTVRRTLIHPFDFEEWKIVMKFMVPWYRPYFEFAVQTGLRPSEQVALKWTAIDKEFIHIVLSRVRNKEKSDLKTEASRRSIEIRPSIRKILETQRELTATFDSPYVFVNICGRPILQDKLRELWMRVMKKTGVPYRTMYQVRHTFASWALGAGESPAWVAKTMGHADTSMVYRVYGRYIPNLTRKDGTVFESQYSEMVNTKKSP